MDVECGRDFSCAVKTIKTLEVSVENFTRHIILIGNMDAECVIQNASRSYHLKELCVGYVCYRRRRRRVC